MAHHPTGSSESLPYLNAAEINEFLDEIDQNRDGYIYYSDVKKRLDQIHDELGPQASRHAVEHNRDPYDRNTRLFSRMQSEQRIHRDSFVNIIHQWKIPSLQQVKKTEDEKNSSFQRTCSWRKLRAYWVVHGPEVVFIGLVAVLQIAFGVWQLIKYRRSHYIEAFGWRFVVAKTCAGALYPTFFFLILSASRYFSTALRRSYYLSLIFNWDLSHNFHIRISYVALLLALLHSLGHLTGTFVNGSDPSNSKAVAKIIGPGNLQYTDYMRSLSGFTGTTALGLFCIVFLTSLPQVRRWNYNIFQLGHLLIYPITGLLMAHGTAAVFQQPLFGYFLAFPAFLVISERISRVVLGFYHIKATLEILDDETVEITAVVPGYRPWDFTAGQYIFLQVPEISFFQWHPFTISFCRDKKIKVHIKTDGDWTNKLRKLGAAPGESWIEVGISGPFGAPAQRFNDFKYSIVVGSGIGVTPFSAIIADLQHNHDLDHGGPGQDDVRLHDIPTNTSDHEYRRTDFHWIVRDGNYLLWLSELLNKVSISQKWHRERSEHLNLDLRIHTHITARRSNIATHIYSWLLEEHRTNEHPTSPLTGLLNPTLFGRPNFDKIFDDHYDDMRILHASRIRQPKSERKPERKPSSSSDDPCKVGVFYCGAAAVGEILADKCSELTIRGRHDGSKIEYHFMMEVFG